MFANYHSKIVRDVGPMLTPDEELQDIAEAEAAVNAKDAERAIVVDAIQNELRSERFFINGSRDLSFPLDKKERKH